MNIRRLASRAMTSWQNWRQRRAMHRAIPELRELDAAQKQCRSRHKRGSAALQKRKMEAVNAALMGNGSH